MNTSETPRETTRTTPPGEAAIAAWLRQELARVLGVDGKDIDPRERFKTYGLDSARATALVAKLGAWMGRSLRVTLLWEQPTIDLVAAYLARGESVKEVGAAPATARRADEPIAVIGIGCRFPGKASSPRALWELLTRRTDAVSEVPPSRWEVADWLDPDRLAPGRMTTRWGGFIDDVHGFDARFFGVTPREAVHIDPQQRLMLELAWEALEDASVASDALVGTKTGVFVGAMWSDYARIGNADPELIAQHTATGQDTSLVAARISYTLGLQGPSLTVNTACSSSLLAVHLACESLRRGESELAIAGGVSLVLSPLSTVAMTKFGAMSPEGRCRAFDAAANGYVRGEGGGLVVLKPLSRAIADNDPIYCVVLGGAVNNDGFSNGLTAPNPKAQEDVVREAGARAGVDLADVQYVETHGPGTLLGDPIEANALGAVFGKTRAGRSPLRLGSIKTNFGHTEAAAGIAGLIKVALCIKHRTLVPNLHFRKPNPHIAFEALQLAVQTQLGPWPDPARALIAGVSSFGFGGTNCHLVVAEPRARESSARVLPLAASSSTALRRALLELVPPVASLTTSEQLEALCGASGAELAAGEHRLALVASSVGELRTRILDELARPETDVATPPRARVVFVCPGQGSQWLGMALGLMRGEPVFRARIEECDRAIQAEAGWSLIAELTATEGASRLALAHVVQPVLFSIQVALGALWRSWGVEPAAVVGHSMGEVAACHLAGVLDLADAVRIMCTRSRLANDHAGNGGMLVVDQSAEETLAVIAETLPQLAVGAYNSPVSTVLSGDAADVDRAALLLQERGIRAARVNVNYASHSAHMDALRPELLARLAGVTPRRATTRLVSTLRAADIDGTDCDAAYWADNLRQPVRLLQVVEKLVAEEETLFLELSPHPILTRSIEETIARRGGRSSTLASCRRDLDERASLLAALATVYVAGADVRWDRIAAPPVPARQLLPAAVLADRTPRPTDGSATILPLSAKSPAALTALLRACGREIRRGVSHRDLAYTVAIGRTHLSQRVAVVATTAAEFSAALEACERGERHPDVIEGAALKGDAVLLLAGDWSECAEAARALQSFAVFRDALGAGVRAAARHGAAPLADALARAPEGDARARALLHFVVPVALAALWRSWGVEPRAIVATPANELAAAVVEEKMSLTEAASRWPAWAGSASFEACDPATVAERIQPALSRDDDAILDAHGAARSAVSAQLAPLGVWVALESEAQDPARRLLCAVGRLYAGGAAIRWPAVYPDGGRRVSAPSYPWQRRRYWLGDLVAKRARRHAPHPLVGPAQTIAGQPHLVIFESALTGSRLEELAGHDGGAKRDAPPGAIVEMAAASARQRLGSTLVTLEELVIERPLQLGACETAQVVTDKREPDRVSVQVASLDTRTSEWTTHASCRARAGTTLAGVHQTPAAVIARCGAPTAGASYYATLARRGWNGALAPIETFWQSEGEAIARLKLPDEVDVDTFMYLVHPALFEACVHAGIGLGPAVGSACASVQRIERVSIHARLDTGTAVYMHVQRRDQGAGRVLVDAAMVDEAGRAIVEVTGLALSLTDAPQGRLDDGADHSASASVGE